MQLLINPVIIIISHNYMPKNILLITYKPWQHIAHTWSYSFGLRLYTP